MPARLPYKNIEELPEASRPALERIIQTRGKLLNVFRMTANSPGAVAVVSRMGEYLRYESVLPDDVRELAILSVARHVNCYYEWVQHWHAAVKAGVPERLLTLVGDPALLDEPDPIGCSIRYVHQLLAEQGVDDDLFQRVLDHFGPVGAVDLTTLVGFYRMLAGIINTFGVELEEDTPPVPF